MLSIKKINLLGLLIKFDGLNKSYLRFENCYKINKNWKNKLVYVVNSHNNTVKKSVHFYEDKAYTTILCLLMLQGKSTCSQ